MIGVVFVFTHTIGDPAALMLPDGSPEAIATLRQRLGLNEPAYVQLGTYLAGIARLDLGTSVWQRVPNVQLIASRLPNTLVLAISAMVLATLVGVGLGLL